MSAKKRTPTFIRLYANCHTTGEMASFCMDVVVRGYHEYQDVWTATSGERLKCAHKIGNRSEVSVAVHFGFHSLIHCTNHR